MLKIQSGQFIDVMSMQGCDNMGQPEVQVTIQGNFELIQMQTDIMTLRSEMSTLVAQLSEEARLRSDNPALQDVYNQYQIVYELVKTADAATGNDGGG